MSEPTDPIAQIAEEFVERLFTNGGGDVADRLVLTVDAHPRRELGGWCRGAIIDRLVVLLRAQRTEGRQTLKALIDKLDVIAADPQFQSMAVMSYIHGVQYTGPNWATELAAAKAFLASGEDQ